MPVVHCSNPGRIFVLADNNVVEEGKEEKRKVHAVRRHEGSLCT